jgi:hypothetical protein
VSYSVGTGSRFIFTVTNPTVEQPSFISYFDDPGFTAIGTGGMLAESTLYAFEHGIAHTLEQTIYHATYAKFVAESASDVGESTYLYVLNNDGTRFQLGKYEFMNRLRDRYLRKGKPTIPQDASEMIDKEIKSITPSTSQTSTDQQ